MCSEIETKLKVDSHKEIIDRLAELGAEFLEEQLQTDYYFDDTGRSLTKTDRCLRLRRQLTEQEERIFLAYKGAREKGQFKKRQEIEIEVKDAHSSAELLLALGYEKALVFEKRRRIWRLNECVVALDELPLLGSFVEIEGQDDKRIADVQRDLNLANLPHIKESYASLMEKRPKENRQLENRK